MRKIFYGLAGLVVLLIVAAVVGPSLVDWNGYKGEIAAKAKEAIGRELRIGGNIDLGLIPSPRLAATDIRISNLPGATSPDMIRVAKIAVEVRLIPLLSGRVEVAGVRLVNPLVELERLADGRVNWKLDMPASAPSTPSAQKPARDPADAQSVRLDSLVIENGTIIYRERGKVVEQVEKLTAELAAESLSGPFRIKGGFAARGLALTVAASVGELGAAAPAPVRLALGIPDSGAEVRLTGSAAEAKDGLRLQGKLQVKADDLHRLVAAGDRRPSGESLALPLAAQGQVDVTGAALTVNDLEVQFGETTAAGKVAARFGDKTEAEVTLKVGRVNLDKLLAETSHASSDSTSQPKDGRSGQAGAPAPSPGKSDEAFSLPADLTASLDVTVDAVTYKGGTIRDARFAAVADKGEVELKRAAALLPGGGRIGLAGRLKAVDGKPSFQGSLDAGADNLRVLLGWLGGNVEDIPPDRLRALRFAAKVSGNPDQLQLLDLDVVLDASRITGGVTYALRARPAFGASIAVDQFNADAYLPAAPAKPAPRAGVQPGRAAAGQPAQAPEAAGLAALTEFDANVALRVGTLTYRQTAVQGVAVDATLFNGRLNVREARVRSIAGTSLSLKGEVAGFTGIPTFKGTVEGESRDVSGLLRLSGATSGGTGRPIGPAKLRGHADAAQDRVKLDARLDLAGLAATLDANVSGLEAAPRFDVALNATHPELSQFAAILGLAGSPLRGKGQLDARLRGTLEAVDFESKFNAAGASFAAGGKVADPMGRGAADLTLALNHPDFAQLMRVVYPDYQAGDARPGALEAKAAIKGDNQAYAVSGLRVAVGQMAIGGDATVALRGARPKLTASLDGSHLDLNRILPPKPQARPAGAPPGTVPQAGGGGASSGSPFTREPIDLSALGDADADVKFASRSLTYRNFRVEEPRITLTLADRVLKINEMVGRMFDGGVDVKAEVDGRAAPKLQAAIKIDRANVGKALFDTADVDLAKGTLDFELSVAGAGKSSQDLAASLGGAGKLSVTNGSVKGFSLRAASDRLKNIDRPADLLGLLQPAMGGGETQFSSLAGTFNIERGVLKTDDTKLVADAGAGDVKGTVDLGRWHMDMMGWFRLTEHPNAPPFGMRMVGPPDAAQRIFDTNELQRFLVSRGVGTLLRKVVPQQQQPAAQQPAPQQQQQQQQQQRQKPEDILKDLLRGLRRPQ
jgi:uncharacterized protein involved in outer membrane biogenesis